MLATGWFQEVELASRNCTGILAGFLHYFKKPAGWHLGQFLKIHRNWV